MSDCKDFFLDDITDVFVVSPSNCQIPVPFSVQGITQMSNVSMTSPVFSIGNGTNKIPPVDGSLSAKYSQSITGNGLVFDFQITANFETDSNLIQLAYYVIGKKDHYICLKTKDGSYFLCYSIPNTFSMSAPVTMNNGISTAVTFSLKAKSGFIPITFLANNIL